MSFMTIQKQNGLGILEFLPTTSFLTVEILEEFQTGFRTLADDDDVKLIISFAPNAIHGMNISFIYETIKARDEIKTNGFLCGVHNFIKEMYKCPKPTLGVALGTHLLGGGLEIFLPCKYFLVSPHTMLGLVETGIGIMPGFGGTFISRIIGVRRAAEMIAGAKMYSADEAMTMGLVDEIIADMNAPKKEIAAFARKILAGGVAQKISAVLVPEDANFTEEELLRFAKGKSRFSVENALAAIREGARWGDFWEDFWEERARFLRVIFAPCALEGAASFLEKRRPNYSDKIA